MRDHDDRLCASQPVDRLDDGVLAFSVDVGRGLVEYVHGRVVEQRAGQCQALPLPARKVAALLGHRRVQAARRAHEPVNATARKRRPQLVVGSLRIGHEQVRAHGPLEQVARERHDGHGVGHRRWRGLGKRHAPQFHPAREARVAAAQDACQCGLARSALAHDARKRPYGSLEVHVGQHGALAIVGVAHVAAAHARSLGLDHPRAARGLRRVQDGEHLVGHGHAVHCRVKERPQRSQGNEELGRQEHECKRSEEGHLPCRILHERHDDANRGSPVGEDIHDRHGVQLHGQKPHGRPAKAFRLAVHILVPALVGAIYLERGQALQVLQKRCAQIGVGAPICAHGAFGYFLDGHDG